MMMRAGVATAAVLASVLAANAGEPAKAPVDPAQAIAHKFATASESKPAQGPAQSSAQTTDAKPADAPVTAKPERPSLDYEMEMLRRARAEAAELKKQEAAKAVKPSAPVSAATATPPATVPPAVSTSAVAPAVTGPITGALPTPPSAPVQSAPAAATAIAAPAPVSNPAATPPAPSQPAAAQSAPTPPATLADVKPAATPTPAPTPAPSSQQPATQAAPPAAAAPTPPAATAAPVATAVAKPKGAPATILLVLDPSVAAMNSKPDPIICLGEVCYVSKGLETPARVMARGEALALKSTAEAGSDFCQAKSGCVYRDVAVPDDVQISVIDLGQSSGTGAEAFTVSVDTSCKKDEDGLACDNPLITHGFTIWTVPEATAKSLGPVLLEDAVADGLPQGDDARSTDK